jgi:hypothetical protein
MDEVTIALAKAIFSMLPDAWTLNHRHSQPKTANSLKNPFLYRL